MKKSTRPATYGLMAEFDNPSDAVAAARRVHEEGYRRIDAFSPFPVEELSEAIGVHKTHMPLIVLIGGLLGGTLGFLMQVHRRYAGWPGWMSRTCWKPSGDAGCGWSRPISASSSRWPT